MESLDKSKPRTWKNGDTFAIKINDGSKYDGRYLILIKYEDEYIKHLGRNHLFRVKLTKDVNLPKEIEDTIYIKTFYINYVERFAPYHGGESYEDLLKRKSHLVDIQPDEYNYLYYYLICLKIRKNEEVKDFIYLGNYQDDNKREYELIPSTVYYGMPVLKANELEEELIKAYENYNLKKHYDFTKEGNKISKEKAQNFWEMRLLLFSKAKEIREGKIQYERIYNSGWGYKLYESDIALDTKEMYKRIYKEEKTINEIMSELLGEGREIIDDPYERQRFWMVLADLQMKNGKLDEKLKKLALVSIREDLDYWKYSEYYLEREKELNKLKKRLEEYECKE